MKRRWLLAPVVLMVTLFGAQCHLVFKLERIDNSTDFFVGCYVGLVTDPVDGGKVRVIIDRPGGGDTLSGCIESGSVLATLTGAVEPDNRQQARFTAVANTGGSFSFRAIRQPAGELQATALDLEDINLSPFRLATGLPVCSPGEVVTCEELFMAVPFLPSGGVP